MEDTLQAVELKPKDYASGQEVKWCPGCGDYAVLNAVQRTLAACQSNRDNLVFVSGIGCSSRFPYYMDTYGFHTIHGRALPIATGVKVANPELDVWVATGDGDALAIGGNHFIHAIRRNPKMVVILFNNEIYGLTKGQFSPTSRVSATTKSSPHGTIEEPFNPGLLALGAGCTFYARVPDTDVKLMTEVFTAAHSHEGLAFVEVLQNCVIFNDKIHSNITAKDSRADNQLVLTDGKPMLFGSAMSKGLRLNGLNLEVVTLGEDGITEADILIHDAHTDSPTLHGMLMAMRIPTHPAAMGVIRAVKKPTYDSQLHAQMATAKAASRFNNLDELFNAGNTFEIRNQE